MPGDEHRRDLAASSTLRAYLQEDAEDLYEHAPCGYLSWLPDGTIVKVNQTFLDWTGYDRFALVGRLRFPDLLTIGGKLYLETHLGPLLRMQDEVREVALDIRRPDGSTLPVLLNSVLHRDREGGAVVVRTTVFDATDRRSYEREILLARRAEQAARERVERLQDLTARLAATADVEDVVTALSAAVRAEPRVVAVEVDLAVGTDPVPGDDTDELLRLPLALTVAGEHLGVVRVTADSEEVDRELLEAFAAQGAQAISRARLAARDRTVARTLQESLLAGGLPEDPRLPIGTCYRPAVEGLQVGGDWFDAFHLTDDVIGVVVGDVVGRGVEAAGSMGQLRSAVRALAGARPRPAELLQRLDGFSERVRGAEMATLAYAEVDLGTGRMRYACAGHPPPLVLAPDTGPVLLWEGRSPPLGAYLSPTLRGEGELVLRPGSRVVLYTDGLVERRRRGLDEQLGRLCDEVAVLRNAPLGSFGARIADAMLADADAPDDVCVLAFDLALQTDFERDLSHLEELSALRDDLRGWLRLQRIAGDDAYAVVLSCSEAVANAIEHGHRGRIGRVLVRARRLGPALEVTVTDEGTWSATSSSPDRGRGMGIIRAVMSQVEVIREGGTAVRMRRMVEPARP